jgi:hypothetical protein
VKVRYTIEPANTLHVIEGEIDIDDEDLDGDEIYRNRIIDVLVEEAVHEDCPWGWEIVEESNGSTNA